MDCIRTICLYLKKYVSTEQFIDVFFEYIYDFQNSLEEDIYLNILSTNFNSKQEKIHLDTKLYHYILENNKAIYEEINDSYIERLIDLNEEDVVINLLKKKYEKKEEVDLDCSKISTQLELIAEIKKALEYPQFCGNNWHAVEDLIYDVIFPKKLIFSNWGELKRKLPEDADILRALLDRNNNDRCIIIYR